MLTLSGDLLTSFSPFPNPGFGIRNVAWHPTGVFLALGGWEEKVDRRFMLSPRVTNTPKKGPYFG